MEIISLACNECGAPLKAGAETRFLNCAHCGARLQVHRRDDACWTEKIERLEERVERLENAARPRRRRPWRRRDPATGEEQLRVAGLFEIGAVAVTLFAFVDLVWFLVGLGVVALVTAVVMLRGARQDQQRSERRRARRARRGTAGGAGS